MGGGSTRDGSDHYRLGPSGLSCWRAWDSWSSAMSSRSS